MITGSSWQRGWPADVLPAAAASSAAPAPLLITGAAGPLPAGAETDASILGVGSLWILWLLSHHSFRPEAKEGILFRAGVIFKTKMFNLSVMIWSWRSQ